jgi:hypothetical protein
MKCDDNPDVGGKTTPLNLEDTQQIVNGLEMLLEGLCKTGERSIRFIQGYFGQFLTAREYLLKGHAVSLVYPKYDLFVEGVGGVEVKTAKCWNSLTNEPIGFKGNEKNFFANVLKLKMGNFDVLSLVLLIESTPFKIFCINKGDLSECTKPHSFDTRTYLQYHSREDLLESEQRVPPYEIYEIERNLVLDEESYLLWVNPKLKKVK